MAGLEIIDSLPLTPGEKAAVVRQLMAGIKKNDDRAPDASKHLIVTV